MLLERIFGKAAIWGIKHLFKRELPGPPPIEICPYTGREDLMSLLTRKEWELRQR